MLNWERISTDSKERVRSQGRYRMVCVYSLNNSVVVCLLNNSTFAFAPYAKLAHQFNFNLNICIYTIMCKESF